MTFVETMAHVTIETLDAIAGGSPKVDRTGPAISPEVNRVLPAAPPPPLARDLLGHASHHPGLAPQTNLPTLELQHPPPTRTAPHPHRHPATRPAHGHRQPRLRPPTRARQTDPPRPPHRRLHRLADFCAMPASTPPASIRTNLAPIPHQVGQRDRGRGRRPRRHGLPQSTLCADHGRPRFSLGRPARRHRPSPAAPGPPRPHATS